LFGFAWACLFGQLALEQRLPKSLDNRVFTITGEVLGLPQADENSVRFDFQITQSPQPELVGKKVRLGWYSQSRIPTPGSRWQFEATLKRPRGVLNPGGFDREQSALQQRIAANGYVRNSAAAEQLSSGQGVDFLRSRISGRIAVALPDGRGRFVQALALGDTRALSDDDWATLRATGLTHLIAISGFHVGLVAGFGALLLLGLYRVFPKLGTRLPRPQAAALAGLLFAFGYTALAGFALPTVRTLLMIATVLLAKMLRRPMRGVDAFALAMISILLFDPLSVLAPGFWLSFLGVGWLLWCLPHERDAGVLKPFLQAQGVALLGLLPLSVWFFGQASLPGPLTNLIGIPWISLVVVPTALIGVLADLFSHPLAAQIWRMAAWLMDQLWWLLDKVAHWPAAMVWLPEASLAALILAVIGAFWLMLPRGTPAKACAVLLFLPLLWPVTNTLAAAEAEITLIDVGQGLSVLVRTRDHALLFDTGPASERGLDMGESAVVPALHALGVNRLDRLIISHGDNDHSGGMAAVLRAFPNAQLFAPEGWAPKNATLCQRDTAWQWNDVKFRILHPPPFFPYLKNDSSCVLRIEAGSHVALLPGDIEKQVELRLVDEQSTAIHADLLIVPHHGSLTSSSPEFIATVHPRFALMATGANNRFNLPKAEIVQHYRSAGAQTLDSDDTGALRFKLNGAGVTLLESRRPDRPRYWREPPGPGTGYASKSQSSER
ncbi:MAG TPA: DNA internalization-related competence protein ComEC/Rec2, partial [Luteimonas sp.]|nr:DNA internalization-related competence protein ComEC/Rec2 [Luteimonas sp.]